VRDSDTLTLQRMNGPNQSESDLTLRCLPTARNKRTPAKRTTANLEQCLGAPPLRVRLPRNWIAVVARDNTDVHG
jgi:hypothetical protein